MRPWKISAPAMMMRLQRSLIRTGTMRQQKKRQPSQPLRRTRMTFPWNCPGENQVCLHVSDAYQAYAAEMGYTAYLDFFWMKNAFLIDYLADTIRGEGYQLGIISSKDGFRALSR